MIPLGKVEKMTIRAYRDATCEDPPLSGPYQFLINPESYKFHYELEQFEEEAAGSSGSVVKYYRQIPNEWTFEILIDGTGIIKDASALSMSLIGNVEEVDVQKEVDILKKIVWDYEGEIHRNKYLLICWGSRPTFKGTLESLDINYKLFKTDGSPLRVIATLKLREWVDPEQRIRIDAPASPDITHERLFKSEDRIDLLSNRIYNDPRYYIDVSKSNNLNSFRKISKGITLKFPPIK
ncbi:MAG: LysM peptidoglycan-binding domain-containing protein [Ignavibacteria bacterium]|nr:LysM peptidoglycan-binding domain-containing protein [Ignavibacteria bacterium]